MNKHIRLLVASLVAFVFVLLGLLVYFFGFKKSASVPPCPRCNVVMIDVDILRADALPCYGYKRNTTPRVCAFAQKSQLFSDNYSQGPWTLPSMFSTITSLYPAVHGVQKAYRDSLRANVPTLAQEFKKGGYKTQYLGSINPSIINDASGGTKGYDVVKEFGIKEWPKELRGLSRPGEPFFTHLYTPRLHIPYLLKNQSQLIEPSLGPPGFPVTQNDFSVLVGDYLYKNYSNFFTPLSMSERQDLFTNLSPQKIPQLLAYHQFLSNLADPKKIKNRGVADLETYIFAINKGGEAAELYVRLLYDSVLALLDQELEETLSLLTSSELSQNTIVVLYSDHGEEFGERGRYGHPGVSLYNEVIKTPLIIYVPGLPGQNIQALSQNIDIFPTLLSLVGIRAPGALQGSSLLPVIREPQKQSGSVAISQSDSNKFSIYDGSWKLIVSNYNTATASTELFEITKDPDEKRDVSSLQPDVVKNLLVILSAKISKN